MRILYHWQDVLFLKMPKRRALVRVRAHTCDKSWTIATRWTGALTLWIRYDTCMVCAYIVAYS